MNIACSLCGKEVAPGARTARGSVTRGFCEACVREFSASSDKGLFLEAIGAPVLLMQGNPRQVVTANRLAQELFGKGLRQIEQHRGGQVFDCEHSFTVLGCGKDANCEHCKIKNAIVDTFATATPHDGVATELPVRKAAGTGTYALQVSTEKIGELALVRIDRYSAEA